MSYIINEDSIKLIVREVRDTTNTNLFKYNLLALVEFSYKNIDYSETCLVDTLFTVEMESTVDDAGKIKTITVLKNPSDISKSSIDNAISSRLDDVVKQIDLRDEVKILNSKARSYEYAYPMDI